MSGIYGRYGYMSQPYLDEAQDPLHYNALKKIWPVNNIVGEFENDLHIDGDHLDNVYYQAADLHTDIFPDTCSSTGLLPDYERVFGIQTTSGTVTQRRAAVITAMQAYTRKTGRLNPSYFVNLGAQLGYTVSIIEGSDLCFRCGTAISTPPGTPLPHAVFEAQALWTWAIYANVPAADQARWVAMIEASKPAFTKVEYIYT